jgi:hypothetical protein
MGNNYLCDLSNNCHYIRAFIPVTDGDYVTDAPSKLLSRRQVNGLRVLVGVSIPPTS